MGKDCQPSFVFNGKVNIYADGVFYQQGGCGSAQEICHPHRHRGNENASNVLQRRRTTRRRTTKRLLQKKEDENAENASSVRQRSRTTEQILFEEGCPPTTTNLANILKEGCPPTTTYPANISEGCTPTTTYSADIRWEENMELFTLESCRYLHGKFQRDLGNLNLSLPVESRQSLQKVIDFLGTLIEKHQKSGPTTFTFVEMMREKKEKVTGPDKWKDINEIVKTDMARSMFNFKQELKRRTLKVQYFKHPDKASLLCERYLAAYGTFPYREVPLYFAKLFYAEFFLGKKPNYRDLPFGYFGHRKGRLYDRKGKGRLYDRKGGKGRLYDRKGAKRDAELSHVEPPLVRRPQGETLTSTMEVAPRIDRGVRDAIMDNAQGETSLSKIKADPQFGRDVRDDITGNAHQFENVQSMNEPASQIGRDVMDDVMLWNVDSDECNLDDFLQSFQYHELEDFLQSFQPPDGNDLECEG